MGVREQTAITNKRLTDCSATCDSIVRRLENLDLTRELQSRQHRADLNESFKFHTVLLLGECAGCYVQQRKRSDDEAITARATRRYECP
jgi:hypothetical protein